MKVEGRERGRMLDKTARYWRWIRRLRKKDNQGEKGKTKKSKAWKLKKRKLKSRQYYIELDKKQQMIDCLSHHLNYDWFEYMFKKRIIFVPPVVWVYLLIFSIINFKRNIITLQHILSKSLFIHFLSIIPYYFFSIRKMTIQLFFVLV